MEAWITTGVRKGEAGELVRIRRINDRGHEVLAAEGYEFEGSSPCLRPAHPIDSKGLRSGIDLRRIRLRSWRRPLSDAQPHPITCLLAYHDIALSNEDLCQVF